MERRLGWNTVSLKIKFNMSSDASTLCDKQKELHLAIERLKRGFKKADKLRRDAFRKVVGRLNDSILESFRRDEWPRFCQLDEAFERNCGLPVPSLSICGHGTAEIRYTKLLSWFFDSRNPHGLGGMLAEFVFKEYFPKELDPPSFANCQSEAEVELGITKLEGEELHNSLDIMVRAEDWIICVEQKISSAEGSRQLKRYSAALTRQFNLERLICFYLTPDRKAGSDDKWIPISHKDILLSMAQVLRRRVLFPTARHNLKALLWDLMLGPVAQDDKWIDRFRRQVKDVSAQPDRYYVEFSRWLNRYDIDQDCRKMLLTLVEV